MCGRFLLATPPTLVAEIFGVPGVSAWGAGWRPRYNICPSQEVLVVRAGPSGREAAYCRWGLIPAWAKEADIGLRTINARVETAESKPAFRSAFRHRRCLIPADGFYEWQAPIGGGAKRPYCVRISGGHAALRGTNQSDAGARPGLFAMAGLWERWEPEGSAPIESCTILTCEANDALRTLHSRMPVILPPESWQAWLDPATDADGAKSLCRPWPAERTSAYEVSTRINSPRHDGPECMEPASSLGQDLFSSPAGEKRQRG